MAVTPTARLGINTWPLGTDQYLRAQRNADAAKLDDLVAIDLQGTLAGRPAAGIRGRYYFATDDNGGRLYRDTGAAWVRVGGDADTLDGLDSTAFLLAGATAADSNKLGGISAPLYLLTSDANAAYAQITARGARVHKSAAQSIPNDTLTAVNFDSESFDTDALHDLVTNNNQVKLNKVGKWLVDGQIGFAAGGTGRRQAYIRRNGTITAFDSRTANATGTTVMQVSDVVVSTATTDFVDLAAYHEQGAALNVDGGPTVTWLSAVFLGA